MSGMNFTAIVGLDSVKQALLLLAVDPALRGCAMSASVGAGKSTLARAFAAGRRAICDAAVERD
jgi:Mg-chelatase subunit ChlI